MRVSRSYPVFVILAAAAAVHCSSSKTSAGGAAASAVVGPNGGSLASSDGNVAIDVPAGALDANVTLTVAAAASPPAGAIGTVYDFGPDGTKFKVPITIRIRYGGFDLGGHPPSDLRVATYTGSAWQAWPGTALDTSTQTVSGQATHFSDGAIVTSSGAGACYHAAATPYGCAQSGAVDGGGPTAGQGCAIGGPSPCTPCSVSCQPGQTAVCTPGVLDPLPSGGNTCSQQPTCVCNGTPSSSSSSSGGTPGGCPPPPTCAASNPCAQYAGSTVSSCTDTANGPDAVCCYAPGEGVCTSLGGGVGCAQGGPSGGGGGGGGTCPPPPTCATTSNHCPSGTTEKSCSDLPSTGSSSGFTATCCYPPGVDPYAASGSSGATTADASVPVSGGGSGGGP